MKIGGKLLTGILLVEAGAVSKRRLRKLMAVTRDELTQALAASRESLASTGLTLVETDNEVELTASARLSEELQAIYREKESDLSEAAAETLAVVAYAGPISAMEVAEVRGVNAQRSLKYLTLRGFIRVLAPTDGGGVHKYEISSEALKQIGLERKGQLPEYKETGAKIKENINLE